MAICLLLFYLYSHGNHFRRHECSISPLHKVIRGDLRCLRVFWLGGRHLGEMASRGW
jgi:hypothetical protein